MGSEMCIRDRSLDERMLASGRAEVLLDATMAECRHPPAKVGIVIVGAGLTGISAACGFANAGVDLALLEKTRRTGGVWRAFGNPFSRVNSSEPGYRLRLRQRAAPNTNHSHQHEILADCARALEQFGLGTCTYVGVSVLAVQRIADECGWVVRSSWEKDLLNVCCQWTCLLYTSPSPRDS